MSKKESQNYLRLIGQTEDSNLTTPRLKELYAFYAQFLVDMSAELNGDLIPDYKKFTYPSTKRKKDPLTDSKKLEVPNVFIRLKVKLSKANKRNTLITKDIRSSDYILKTSSKSGSKKLTKKQRNIGQNDKSKIDSKFTSSESNVKNRTTTWSPDQILFMERIKENIKFMEPHYKEYSQRNNTKPNTKPTTQPNPYKMRGRNLSGTVHKDKPIFDDKIDHKLGGSKDYWKFRDHGKFGSHSDFDDLGDESNP